MEEVEVWKETEGRGETVSLCRFTHVDVVIEAAISVVIMECSAIKKTLRDRFIFSLWLLFMFLSCAVGTS